MSDTEIDAFWAEFSSTNVVEADYEAWAFGLGTDPAFATKLALLVRDGPKRATAGVLDDWGDEPLPQEGDHSVILDGEGRPVCIIRTTEVTVKPFGQVDAAFAWDEGEGDRTLGWWRKAHAEFFARDGVEVSDETEMILERFDLVWPVD
jgi:uncharacterized protein YhfF